MMAKKLKIAPSKGAISSSVVDTARQIWLAGLGAVTKAESEGSRFFESLVQEGENVEARSKKTAEKTVGSTKSKASESWEKLEDMFEQRVARVLHQLGVPTHNDIQNLSKQVELLDKSIKALTATKKKTSSRKTAGASSR